MIKRILPLAVTVALLVCLIAVPVLASGSDGLNILNYKDYITGYDIDDNDTGWAYLYLPNDLCAVQTYDKNGYLDLPAGKFSGSVTCFTDIGNYMSITACWPGSYMTNTFMDVMNIPDGSSMSADVNFLLYGSFNSGYQTDFIVRSNLAVVYFDSNLNFVGEQAGAVSEFLLSQDNLQASSELLVTLEKPGNAAFCCFYGYISLVPDRSNDVEATVEFSIFNPTLHISTSYVEIIIDGIVNGTPPPGYDSMNGLGDLEDYLQDNTSSGRLEAEEIFDKTPGIVASHISGFLFLSDVIERMLSVGWLDGILVVSLSLGILGFIGNIAVSAGRAFEHRAVRRGGKA